MTESRTQHKLNLKQKLPHNELYDKYNVAFGRVLLDIDDDTVFERAYVPVRECGEFPIDGFITQALANRLEKDPLIGRFEQELFTALLNPAIPVLVVVGKVGTGKSTIARTAFSRAIKRHQLSHVVEVWAVDFNDHVEELNHKFEVEGEAAAREYIRSRIIQRVQKYIDAEYSTFYEPFWTHLESADVESFRQHARRLRDMRQRVDRGMLSRPDFEVQEQAVRESYLEDEKSVWEVVRYKADKERKRLVLVLDNIDPLLADIQMLVLRRAREVHGDAGVLPVVPMRPQTFFHLKLEQELDHFRMPYFEVDKASIRRILERRLSTLLYLRTSASIKPEVSFPVVDKLILEAMGRFTISPHVIDQLMALSNGNLRLVLQLLSRYFSSGHFDMDSLAREARASGRVASTNFDPYLFSKIVLTNNYNATYEPDSYEFAMNLWCDGSSRFPISHFGRLAVIVYSSGRGSSSVRRLFEVREVVEILEPVYKRVGIENGEEIILKHIYALLRYRLLDSPLGVHFGPRQISPSWLIQISDAGQVYADRLAWSTFYFGFMKDAMRIKQAPHPFRSLLCARTHVERLEESITAMVYLEKQEARMLEMLGKKGDRLIQVRYIQACFAGRASAAENSRSPLRSMVGSLVHRHLLEAEAIYAAAVEGRELPPSEDSLLDACRRVSVTDEEVPRFMHCLERLRSMNQRIVALDAARDPWPAL